MFVLQSLEMRKMSPHLALEFLGCSFELALELFELGRLLGYEEQIVRLDLAAEDDRRRLLTELADEREAIRLNPCFDSGDLGLLVEVDAAVVERLEEDDAVFLELERRFRRLSVVNNAELNVVDGGGRLEERFCVVGFFEVADHRDVGRLLELAHLVGALELFCGRTRLLFEPSDNRRLIATAAVLSRFAVAEKNELKKAMRNAMKKRGRRKTEKITSGMMQAT